LPQRRDSLASLPSEGCLVPAATGTRQRAKGSLGSSRFIKVLMIDRRLGVKPWF
jgi:hypothetical protein